MGRLLAFGEPMLRFSPPGRELLFQSPRLDVWVGGAEANVVTALARLGHDVGFASRVPDDDLGRHVVATLRGHGVDTRGVAVGGDRLGVYYVVPGAGVRATEVVYDRKGSAFATAPADCWAWERLLDGVDRLHLSGVTPALGPSPAAAALAAAEAASARGIPVSFDGNWRGKLWAQWNGDPRAILSRIVAHADILFGNHRDIGLLLGRGKAANAATAAFPRLTRIASTARQVVSADLNRIVARIDAPDGAAQTERVEIAGIVDRIGAGDAFAAGVLHALRAGGDIEAAARTGLALTALKHSLPGDASLFGQDDIDGYLSGGLDVRR